VLRVSSARFSLLPSSIIPLATPLRTCTVTLVSLSIARPSLHTLGNGNDGVGSLYLDARRTHSWYSRPSLLSRAPVVTIVISGLVVSGGRSWKRRCRELIWGCVENTFVVQPTLSAVKSTCGYNRDQWACCEWGGKVGSDSVGDLYMDAWRHIRGTADPLCCQEHLWSRA